MKLVLDSELINECNILVLQHVFFFLCLEKLEKMVQSLLKYLVNAYQEFKNTISR